MKVEELMVGDFVYHKVKNIDGSFRTDIEQLNEGILRELLSGTSIYFSIKDYSPVPLTAEILEKNGWVFMEGQDYSTFPVPSKWTRQFVPFALKVDGETYSIANTFTIKYVHELQRALRCAGLWELANSFRVN